jgi:hypothetical protein
MIKPPSDYRSMSADEVLDDLYLQLYLPPFWKLREDLRSVPEVLRIPILIFDFHNEVCVNSILGFLENSTGSYLADTIGALETIGANDTAAILRSMQRIMADHGVTYERLRTDHFHMQEWQITTVRGRHGEELSHVADLIGQEAEKLYIYDNPHNRERESVFDLLSAYIEQHRDELAAALGAHVS